MQSRDAGQGTFTSQTPAWPGSSRLATLFAFLVGITGFALMAAGLYRSPPSSLDWWGVLVFSLLSFLVQRSSFHFGSPMVHSLAGTIDLAAVLALGPAAGATVASVSGLVYLELNALHYRRFSREQLLDVPLFNSGLKALAALGCGLLIQQIAGPLPVGQEGVSSSALSGGSMVLSVLAASLLWFTLDHFGWGLYDFFNGGLSRVRMFLRDAFPAALLLELLPLPLSLVIALVYGLFPWTVFAILALAIVGTATIAQLWADARTALTQRVTELSSVEAVGRAIAGAELDVEQLCQLLYDHATDLTDTTIFHLGLFEGDRYDIRLWMRDGQPEPARTFQLEPGKGLVGWLRESRQPILVRDFVNEADSLPARPLYVSEHPPRSAIFVPLQAGDAVIGTMSLQSYQPNSYGESDLRVLSTMANEAALAIEKARLYDQERVRARQLETIGQVGRQVAALLDLESLFQQTVHLIRESFGYYHVAIYTIDRTGETVSLQASANAARAELMAAEVSWGEGLIGWAASEKSSVIVNDVLHDRRYRCIEPLEETRSEMAVPLLLDEEAVGVLDVQSDQVDAFGSSDLFILETLGDQVALAIHGARLYEAEQRQAWLATTLLQVADATSRLPDMDAVLTGMVRLPPLLAGVERCAILLWDPDTESFTPAQTHGVSEPLRTAFEELVFAPGDWPALDLIRYDRAPLVIGTAREPGVIPSFLEDTFAIEEMVMLPLQTQGELLGAMLVDHAASGHTFGETMVELLAGIANQSAIGLQNARLLEAQKEEAYVSMALLQVADSVSRSSELDEALAAIVRITPLLLGVEACGLYLRDRESETYVPRQQYGLKSEAESTFWGYQASQDEPFVQQLVDGAPFCRLDEVVGTPEEMKRLAHGTLLAFPMVLRGEVVGFMAVDYTASVGGITDRGTGILTGIAGQAAIAVENDRLLGEAAEQERIRQELAVAHQIQTSFLPERCPDVPGWDVAAVWRAAREVAGDFYDFVPLVQDRARYGTEGDSTGVVIADVADKGVPAALFMALSRTLMRTMAIAGRSPAQAVRQANNLILSDARSDLFVTLFYGILSSDSGQVTFTNAGHMPPLVLRGSEGSAETLHPHDMAMAVLPDVEFTEHKVHLSPGDVLILYTDGVVDASNSTQSTFGTERLVEVALSHRTEPAEEMAAAILSAVTDFVGDAPRFDDLTFVVARRQP